jgi:D-alanine-D-alanine ligase
MPGIRTRKPRNGAEMALPGKIAIIYSEVRREDFPTEELYITEKDADVDAEVIGKHLEALGVAVLLYPGNAELPERLRHDHPDLVINLVDSVKGDETQSSTIPAVLELLGIPYTGTGVLGMALDSNKFVVHKVLQQNGIPVPHHQLFVSPTDYIDPTLRYPLISKLNAIHGSVEIGREAISENERHLRKRLRFLMKTYDQSVIVEEYVGGREVTAILLEGMNKKVYMAEKVFANPHKKYTILSFEEQWLTPQGSGFHYVKYEDPVLREYVRRAFDIMQMSDYAKFDVRLERSGRYYFIDSNCNPAFGPKEMDVALSVILDLYGISFYEILKRLILNTMRDSAGKDRLPMSDAEAEELEERESRDTL